jgi:outer membrane biosynthesis protein TonB
VSLPNSKSSEEQNPLSGSITNHGTSSVNATGTPLGRYQKMVYDAIGTRWYQNVEKQREVISNGTARASFWIERDGRVTNLKVIQNTSNETFANICIHSILEIKLPPIPKGVADVLPPKGLETQISFTISPDSPTNSAEQSQKQR